MHNNVHMRYKTLLFWSCDNFALWLDLIPVKQCLAASVIHTSDSLTQKISDNLKTRGSRLVTAGAALTMAMPKTKTENTHMYHYMP